MNVASATANTTMHAPTTSEASKYRAILQRKIDEGSVRAAGVIEAINTQQPKDQIFSTRAVRFAPGEKNVVVSIGGESLSPSDHAIGQLATRAGIPTAYLRDLAIGADDGGWRRQLAADVLSRHYVNGKAERLLARSVNGQLRGWLSDRYRRLDSRPLVDALGEEAMAIGAVPCDGSITETRCAIKLLMPTILEPIPGEFIVPGGEWSNSDYGNGTHSFRGFALRVACLNGMTRENLLREIHLGGRLADDVVFSDKTYQLDTAASVSALRDIVRGALSPAGVERMCESIRAAHEKKMSVAQLRASTKAVDKKTQTAIVDAFESMDVINLPAGSTAWRASNAVSWIARHTEDAEARLDLERLAGTIG